MASVVFGLGTAHGSQVSLPAEAWVEHAELDRHRTNYEDLIAARGDELVDEIELEVLRAKHDRVQAALSVLSSALQSAEVDVAVIVGDDQHELFLEDGIPSIALYWGDEIQDLPPDLDTLAPSHRAAVWAVHGDEPESYPVDASLGRHIVETAMTSDFDICQLTLQPSGRSLGHAYTFVRRRLMGPRAIPIVPIFLNTYFPPNQPSAARCVRFGQVLAEALASFRPEARVAVIASGGLSHFVVDEELDRAIIEALTTGDFSGVCALPSSTFQSGTSEVLNWLAAGSCLYASGLRMNLIDYVPGYRSLAGTGCGMTFAEWRPQRDTPGHSASKSEDIQGGPND